MSQQYRRIPLDEFVRQAASILDGITARGETVLIEHKGRFYTLGKYQAYRKRSPGKPQSPNMQDSLWNFARTSDVELNRHDASAPADAEELAESLRRPSSASRRPGITDSEPSE